MPATPTVDLTNTQDVLAGTLAGECSQGGRPGMENVGSVIMQRVQRGWQPSYIGVCMAPAQFSCWFDQNRERILDLPKADPKIWGLARLIAGEIMAGALVRRTGSADSYFARSMAHPPFWAKPPAHFITQDEWHQFWQVRLPPVRQNVAHLQV